MARCVANAAKRAQRQSSKRRPRSDGWSRPFLKTGILAHQGVQHQNFYDAMQLRERLGGNESVPSARASALCVLKADTELSKRHPA